METANDTRDAPRPPWSVDPVTQQHILAIDNDKEFIHMVFAFATNPQYSLAILWDDWVTPRLARIQTESPGVFNGEFLRLSSDILRGPSYQHLVKVIGDVHKRQNGHGTLGLPETLTNLLDAPIDPPLYLFHGLMHEGLLLFGGKSKRGKSWLIYDLAISLALGRAAFQHFACPEPMPVLYLALEDGRARLQGRARMIQPDLKRADSFHLRYSFPPLSDGGVEALIAEIQRWHYGLVIIDILAKLESPSSGKGDKNYHEVYETFGPLQTLRNEEHFCLAMLTHLRKQDADDRFDTMHGSVAYQGAQDVLWVLERKPKDDYAFLHIRDKDAEEQTLALHFTNGHWEYQGDGEEYKMTRDQRKIIRILWEEGREMRLPEIQKAAGFTQEQYGYVRKLLVTMVGEDMIHRSKRGNYSATIRAKEEIETENWEQGIEIQ